MRLRTKLLIGILGTLLLQIAVTGTFTLSTFAVNTRRSLESELTGDWDRARAYVEELKHRLTMDLYQVSFFLQEDQTRGCLRSRSSRDDALFHQSHKRGPDRAHRRPGSRHRRMNAWGSPREGTTCPSRS